MRRSFLITFFSLLILSTAVSAEEIRFGVGEHALDDICQGTTGELSQSSQYPNGGLRIKAGCKDGQFHGIVKKYGEDQKILIKAQYENGVLNGVVKFHGKDGEFLFREHYENGTLQGRFEYSKGELVRVQ